jgi:hypothetical protein
LTVHLLPLVVVLLVISLFNGPKSNFTPYCCRGNLNLTILPTSDLRLSFVGDDCRAERLFTLNSKSQCAAVAVDEIPADSSCRSFLIKIPDGQVFYFWCSEKSKLLGIELLAKVCMISIMCIRVHSSIVS